MIFPCKWAIGCFAPIPEKLSCVSRMVGAFAAGPIMNPITARSQLMGGVIRGISSALPEATEIDHRFARYTNDNLAPPIKLMMDRLVCADGGNPDPTSTDGKDAGLAKTQELDGWDYPRHLAGRAFSVIVHGDIAGAEGVQRSLSDWLLRGTRDPEMFIKPAKLRAAMQGTGLVPGAITGVGPRGINRRFDLTFGPLPLTAVIYMGVARRSLRAGAVG